MLGVLIISTRHLTITGWLVFLLLLYWFTKSRTGYAMVYYTLVLILVFLLLNHYKEVESTLTTQ